MRLIYIPFLLVILLVSNASAQSTKSLFDEAILLSSTNKLDEATTIFKKLYRQDSTNMNLAYLLGQCYARTGENLDYSIYLLNKAKEQYSKSYKKRHYDERKVSEYVYYYLLMAYSKNGQCDKTIETLNQFYMIYSYENEWFLIEGQELHHSCVQRDTKVEEKIVEASQEVDQAQIEKYEPNSKRHIIGTKKVSYTSRAATWGVQVGASLEPQFTYEFQGVKNVEVYVDDNGVYRYVIGKFIHKIQAERLLESIKKAGYPDAFILNTKEKSKFSEQVLTLDNESISKKLFGKVDFRVQIGAFRGDTIPQDLMDIYLKLDSISEFQNGDLTILTVGSFKNIEEAQFLKELVQDIGVNDAFVAAFNYNRRVDLKQAIYYLEEQQRIIREKRTKEINKRNKEKSRKSSRK